MLPELKTSMHNTDLHSTNSKLFLHIGIVTYPMCEIIGTW